MNKVDTWTDVFLMLFLTYHGLQRDTALIVFTGIIMVFVMLHRIYAKLN